VVELLDTVRVNGSHHAVMSSGLATSWSCFLATTGIERFARYPASESAGRTPGATKIARAREIRSN
jgi:hypothetical protein